MSSAEKKTSARKRTTSSTTPRNASTATKSAAKPAAKTTAKATTLAPRVRVTRTTKSARVASPPTHQDIERRAYELFLRDGGQGSALEHWLRAERELRRV